MRVNTTVLIFGLHDLFGWHSFTEEKRDLPINVRILYMGLKMLSTHRSNVSSYPLKSPLILLSYAVTDEGKKDPFL